MTNPRCSEFWRRNKSAPERWNSGTGRVLPDSGNMVTVEECTLKADNYASAAMLVGGEDARVLIRLAAIWRNRALRAKIGHRADCLKTKANSDRRSFG
jgi:hypothetical protein